jgi:hypothetical protein
MKMNFAASIEAAEKNLELYEHRKIGLLLSSKYQTIFQQSKIQTPKLLMPKIEKLVYYFKTHK